MILPGNGCRTATATVSYTHLDYLMPGFLYSYSRFREELEVQIVQHESEEASERLRKMIRPFVLRRLKKDVLRDLPEKLEENMYTRLEGEQQKLYDAHVKRDVYKRQVNRYNLYLP